MRVLARVFVVWLIPMGVIQGCGGGTSADANPIKAAPPSAKASPEPGWSLYVDSTFGYSVNIPAGWREVSTSVGASPNNRYFSNEPVSGGRFAGLDAEGVVLEIGVAPLDGRCLPDAYENTAFTPFTTTVDGVAGTVAGYNSSPPADPSSTVFVNVADLNRCYMFMASSLSPDTRDAFIPLFVQILSTFRFAGNAGS